MDSTLKQRFPEAPRENGGYFLAIIDAVAASGGREARFLVGANEVSASYDFVDYPERLAQKLLAPELTDCAPRDAALAIACRSGLLAGAPRVDYESWNGHTGVRWRMTSDSIKTEVLTKSPWKDGKSESRLIVRFRTGLFRELFPASGSGSYYGQAGVLKMIDRGQYGGVRLIIDGKDYQRPFPCGEGLLKLTFAPAAELALKVTVGKVDATALIERQVESRGCYWAQFLYGGTVQASQLFCRGLAYPIELPLAQDLGFSVLIVADYLRSNAELTEIVEDIAYDDFLNDVEADLLGAVGGLVEILGQLPDDRVDSIIETLATVVETHRSAGDLPEAILLLRQLVEAPKLPDGLRATYLTQLAVMLERADRAEESFDFFGRALEFWGGVGEEEQDLELVATALLGAARLMSLYDDDPIEAIDYTRRALELRRSVSDEDDVERGVAAELLGRLYLKHATYPEPEFMEVEPLLKEALLSFERNYGQSHAAIPTILVNLGEFYRQRGSFVEAEGYFLRALAIEEKLGGARSEAAIEIFDRLAAVFETEGDVAKAGQYYERALEVWEELSGAHHESVISRINDLVVLYRVYGFFEKAEPLYLKLVNLREGGKEKPGVDAVQDLCALALFYQVQSKFQQAEPYFVKAITALEDHYGREALQPDLAWVHGLMGRFYDSQYRFKKAEDHLLTSLSMVERLLGEEHPDLIVCLQALSRHYRIQKRYFEAMECTERALAITEQFYGGQHPYVATALNSYAELLTAAGDEDGAAPIYLAAFEIHEASSEGGKELKALPSPDLSRMARVRSEALQLHLLANEPAKDYTRFAEAESLYLRALFLRERALGADHFENARTLELLGGLYLRHRRYEGGESLYRRALVVRQNHLGRTHPDCGISLRLLTETFLMQGKFEEAEPLLKEWLGLVERTLGRHHRERTEVLVRLAKVAESRGATEEQREFLQEAVTIRQEVFGTEHPTFAVTLAELLRVEDKPAQAAELYGFVLSSLEKNMTEEDPMLIPILENYAKVLAASGEEDRAASHEARAMVMRVEYGLDFGKSA